MRSFTYYSWETKINLDWKTVINVKTIKVKQNVKSSFYELNKYDLIAIKSFKNKNKNKEINGSGKILHLTVTTRICWNEIFNVYKCDFNCVYVISRTT